MAADLKIFVTAKDQASGVLAGVGREVDSLDRAGGRANRSMGALGGILKGGLVVGAGMAVAGIGALGAILATSVKAAAEAEEITAQLESVIKSTAGVAGMTADAINDMALSLSEVTRYEDDAIVASSALLLTFTKIGRDVFPKAQKSILNMATAMKMDLQSATVMVGKALNDPILGITAMSRAGIQFTQDQKDMIKSLVEMGDTASAQAMILAELETQFGGSAEAAGKTFAGQMDILKNSLGNVKEEIGFALLPVIKDLVTWAGPRLVSGFKVVSETITTSIDGVRRFFGVISEGMRDGWEFRDFLAEFVREFPNMPAILQDAAAGVAAFVGAFKAEDGSIFDKLKAGFEAVDWATIGGTIKKEAGKLWAGITEAVGNIDWAKVAADINTAANSALTTLQIAWDNVDWEKIQADLTTYWKKTLQPALTDAWRSLEDATATDPALAEDIGAGLAKTFNAAIAFFNERPDQLTPLDTKGIFTSTLTGQQIWDLLITPSERASLKKTFDAFIAELNKNPDQAAWLLRVKDDIDKVEEALLATITAKELFDLAFSQALSNPFDPIARGIQAIIDLINGAIGAYGRWMETFGGGPLFGSGVPVPAFNPFGGVSGGGSVGSSGGQSGPHLGSSGGYDTGSVVVNVYAAGGGPEHVKQAAKMGTIEALRSKGHR